VIGKPTLIVHTTYFSAKGPGSLEPDPERADAVRLGDDLYELLTRPKSDPLAWGAGMPIRVATLPTLIDSQEAALVVVIPVLGFDAFTEVQEEALKGLADLAERGAKVLPVLAAPQWRTLEQEIPKPLLTGLYAVGDPRRATINEILLSLDRFLAPDGAASSRLFISHAKADLDGTGRAAEEFLKHAVTETTAMAFFDKVSLLPGEDLDRQVDEGAAKGVFVAVRGDRYSSRAWCRRELLVAKRAGLPTLTVEVLSAGESRSAAYGGNGPSVVWDRTAKPQDAAAQVLTLAMVAAVRHRFFLAEASRVITGAELPESTTCLSRPPELLDLVALRDRKDGALTVLHPDPPLPVFERELLQGADKRLRPVTPTTAFAGAIGSSIHAPLDGWQIALSLSDASDTPDGGGPLGLTGDHVLDTTLFLARAIVGVGGAIAYGGDFRDRGFTRPLAQIVVSYNETAGRTAQLLHSYLAATINPRDGMGLAAFTPHSLRSEKGAVLAPPVGRVSDARRALYFSDMRRLMAEMTQARVVLSGTTSPKAHDPSGYGGRFPGVVEEAWRTLQKGKPLYVAGGFGGAAALVVEAIEGATTPKRLDDNTWAGKPDWDALVTAFEADPDSRKLELPRNQADLAAQIHALAMPRLASDAASLAWNGLTLEENKNLFRTRDPLTLTALVLKGLIALSTRAAAGKLRVELVEGDVTGASDLELLVFPTFCDVDLDGAGAALDRVSGGAASRAHRSRSVVASTSSALGANCLYAADLGDTTSAVQDPSAAARAAAIAAAEVIRRQRCTRVGVVTFLGNVAPDLSAVIRSMVDGLRRAADTADLVWFEKDPGRAAVVAAVLASMPDQVALTRRTAPSPLVPDRPAKRRTVVTVRHADNQLDVALLLHQANGLAPVVRTDFDDAARLALAGSSADAAPEAVDLAKRGAKIAQLLFGINPAAVLDAAGDAELVVMHDGFAGGIPYEALAWSEKGTTVTPATSGGIVRHLLSQGIAPERALPRPQRTGRLGVLLIVDPRGDLPGARLEGDALAKALTRDGFHLVPLRGNEATVDRVRAAIGDPAIDVLHYCGHAFFTTNGDDGSGLNLAGGELTLGELKKGVSLIPRLAFVNACQSGRVRGQARDVREPESFAQFFLSAGVDAYLGTFWQVSDKGAASFAAEVYAELSAGAELGEAVVRGRKALQEAGNGDWANYAIYGHAGFRFVHGAEQAIQPATGIPLAPSFRVDGSVLVASWPFRASEAPVNFTVAALDAQSGEPLDLSGPIRLDRREGWSEGNAIVTWVSTLALGAPPAHAIALRPSVGSALEVPAATSRSATRGPAPDGPGSATPTPSPRQSDLRRLSALLLQQPDGGRAFLEALQPSADPAELRAAFDAEANRADDRAVWPLSKIFPAKVDRAALEAFVKAYGLDPIAPEEAESQDFQTKEDWQRYVFSPGAIGFTAGATVRAPLWPALPDAAAAMTHPLREGEFKDGSIEIALFSDNGNGLHASRSIAKQVVASGLPYAFHLGDVYYGGSEEEFKKYFEDPLRPMFDRTDFFMIAGNHEMFAKGEWFQDLLLRKATDHAGTQRQRGEMFHVRGPGFRILGIDTMFVGSDSGRLRLHDYADERVLEVLRTWLADQPDAFTILMTTNEAWDKGNKKRTPLYESLRATIAGKVDMWFWGNVHYAALYEPWNFADTGTIARHVVANCIGHGGYPFYTEKEVGDLPPGIACRWLEKKSRFWPNATLRSDVGANGWNRLKLTRGDKRWEVALTFVDWVGRERLRAKFVREDGGTIQTASVEESDAAAVGEKLTWRSVPGTL
jgi:CHAT domain-containing protein